MAVDKLRALKIRLGTMKKSLEGQSQSNKAIHVSQTMAQRFNDTLDTLAEVNSEVGELLPSPIEINGRFKMMGKVEITYVDLEIFIDETIALISEFELEE